MLTQTAMRSGLSTAAGVIGAERRPSRRWRPTPLNGPIEMMGASMLFARNAEIYGENEPADYLYKVISGTVRTYKVLERRPPPDRRLLSPGRHFRPGDGRRAHVLGRGHLLMRRCWSSSAALSMGSPRATTTSPASSGT